MPYYHNDDVINPNGIDFVDVDKLVNPPDASNAGKVIGIGEDGKAALIEVGGGLPEVTSEDNGDVLTVVNGKWAKSEPGGGSSIKLYVTEPPTTDPGVPEGWVADEDISKGLSNTLGGDALTISELTEIIDSYDTISVVFATDDEGMLVYNPISSAYINDETYKAAYIGIFTSALPVTVSKVGAGFTPGQA